MQVLKSHGQPIRDHHPSRACSRPDPYAKKQGHGRTISELLHCLSTLPDPWLLAKITIDMDKPSQWVSKLCRLYFADEYAKRTVGLPFWKHVPDTAGALRAVQAILPKLEVKMIEFLAEWMVTLLMPASHVLEVRAPHLSFMMLKEELYLA